MRFVSHIEKARLGLLPVTLEVPRVLRQEHEDGDYTEDQGLRITMGWPGGSGKPDDRLLYSVVVDWRIETDGMISGQDDHTLSRTTPVTVNAELKPKPSSRSKDPASILEHFAALPDPRREHGRVHMLDEIVFMSICAVLCGADSWQEIADYAQSKFDWLKTFLTLPGGIPSHDTFRRVFCLLDPLAFQACFSDWITALMNRHGLISIPVDPPPLKPIAIDGKTQRGSARRSVGRSPLHMVSAWSVENHLTLGQVATEAKSNEITAIPELLKLLDLEGAIVTIDAMGCQKDIAAGIVQGGGEFVLAAKENQPHLYEDIQRAFERNLGARRIWS